MSQDQPRYRVYSLDGVCKIVSAEWIDADSDEEAIAIVHRACHGTLYELWEGHRLVARIEASRRTA